ncbi:MAG: UvrB/UvrC motif-containing protein [Phycisphaerales bacterium]|nr:UvrB/UvrC motif-containing protein [Phycisphaerales bacterium]
MHKCDLCDKPAVLNELIREKDDQWRQIHLCEDHARAYGYPGSGEIKSEDLAEASGKVKKRTTGRRKRLASCDACGLTLASFRRHGLLGCSECYHAFEAHLEPLIGRAQAGATHHCGHVPDQKDAHIDRRLNRMRLLKELNDAVSTEQYERAARIRDELHSLEECGPEDSGETSAEAEKEQADHGSAQ